MEIRINREVRNYHESIFFGLSARQFGCSLGAVAVAVGAYFLLKDPIGKENAMLAVYAPVPQPLADRWIFPIQRSFL